ncbi:hypothetical protein Ocin01_03660 [Orchesella cincta]|uniref:Uncharacterized protein n=1 Tax=Orchesella cincta TaxID=48709 RepID=A0A1D2NCQ2_ORCCI|nr:hypothetical protein Ocin01_03660 [Orchesella cincta]
MELQASTSHHSLDVNQNEPEGDFFGTPEYAQWQRRLQDSLTFRESFLKFIINFTMYTFDTGSLIFTLFTGLIIPKKQVETVASIVLYVFCFIVTGLISYYNKKYTNSTTEIRNWDVLLNFLTVLKPVRYFKEYWSKDEKLRIVKNECTSTGDNIRVTERALTSLKDLNEELLEYKRAEYDKSMLQAIPMCLLQIYFLLQSYEIFRLCDLNDLFRLSFIFTTILNAAKSCADYQASKSEYEAVLHFLSYFKSQGQHPIKIESQGMLTIIGLLNTIVHTANISHRIYMFSYFLNTSVWIALAYLFLVFLVNLTLVKLIPQHLLEIHQNAPYGISTSLSYWTDRFTDIFVNVSTRYNKFTHNPQVRGFRIPLILGQAVHFFIPFTVCFTIAWLIGNHKLLDSVTIKEPSNTTNTTDYVYECEKLNECYSDLFSVLHLIWLLFYAQLLTAIVYAFSLNGRFCGNNDTFEVYENYPVMVSYGFYSSILDQLLNLETPVEKLEACRRLMVLTILKPSEFYAFQRNSLSNDQINDHIDKLVDPNRLENTPEEIENYLEKCRLERHVLIAQFNALEDFLVSNKDRALFLIFRSYFDRKLYVTQSHRIERVFELMSFQKRKNLV